MIKKFDRCYNCGKVLADGEGTKEHIPAKALFVGYGSSYKVNCITVPACFKCNNQYSKVDEEFRNWLGVMSNRKENNTITDKSVYAFMRKNSNVSRLRYDLWGKVIGVEFKEQRILDFHRKNFKGLFYHQYAEPLPSDYNLIVNIDEDDKSDLTQEVIGYLKKNFEWKCSGHKDILSYCIQPLRENLKNTNKEDLIIEQNDNIIAGALVYNREIGALVYAIKNKS